MIESTFEREPGREERSASSGDHRDAPSETETEIVQRRISRRKLRGLRPDPEQWITFSGRGMVEHRAARPSEDEDASFADGIQRRGSGLLHALNVTVAALGLLLLSPLMLIIALAIKLDSPGPVIYRQLRVGRDRRSPRSDSEGGKRSDDIGGQPFFIYKFRTMRVDAEEDTGPVWASDDDDRCTRVGRVLRKYRLDEIPQLWNVLRGEMSVVGPRPERPAYVRRLRREIESYTLRQRVRPGITGWAQINQGYDSSVDDVRRKVEYDTNYVERRSLWLDLQIMLRTPLVMARPDDDEDDDGGLKIGEKIGSEPA